MSVLQDLLLSLRLLRKAPGFSLVVIVTLALGIGANTAVFSMIDVLLLRPLPYPDSSHLLRLSETKAADSSTISDVAPANFIDWQAHSRAFTGMAASEGFHYNLTGNGQPEHVWGGAGSAQWFSVLGVHAALGRDFHPEEDAPAAAPMVILSDQLWRRRFAADRGIVGKVIGLNGGPFTVLGIMPPKADFREEIELWIPLQQQIRPDRMLWRDSRFLTVIARPKPGVTMSQATDDLNRVAAALRQAHTAGDIYGGAAISTLQKSLIGDIQQMLMVSFAVVGLVLLVACANVANLMLLRVTGRSRELAIRMALGAKPINLVRQLVMEGVCLGATAGTAGLAIGAAGQKLLLWQLGWESPELSAANLSWSVLLFTFGLSVIAGIVFALLPALAVVRAERHDMLRRASSGTTVDVKGRRLRKALAIAEIACSVVLLAGTILVARSFQALRHVQLGFESDHRVEVSLPLPRIRYQRDADVVRFYQQVTEKVRALPGVMDATTTHMLPLNDGHFGVSFQTVEGNASPEEFHEVDLRLADEHYLSALSIPLLRGRFIADTDRGETAPVCVINKAMAQKYWPDKDPMGRLIVLTRNDVNGEKKPRRIVGVVADVRGRINEDPPPAVYVPYAQMSFFNMELLVHTRDTVPAVRKSVAAVLQTIDPDQPIRAVHTFSDALPGALGDWTVAIKLLGGLAALAVLLTTLGLFAVIAYMVREKTREIGIRMAIGATPGSVRNLVLKQTAWLAVAGAVIGIFLSVTSSRFLGSLIYGVRRTDPLTFALVIALLAALAIAASYIPARRAMRVDPILALRDE
ncbi:MAG: macrolide transporter ATP-binding/permease protein [Candidatus Angelobacter sp.]|nr:macrolide transporter ATP-binding/permease protein [Candidatus Angelobacter sp.]